MSPSSRSSSDISLLVIQLHAVVINKNFPWIAWLHKGKREHEINAVIWLTYLASAHPLLGDHILPSPISPRARWERGARSPLAPTVPFSGTKDRQDAIRRRQSEMWEIDPSQRFPVSVCLTLLLFQWKTLWSGPFNGSNGTKITNGTKRTNGRK